MVKTNHFYATILQSSLLRMSIKGQLENSLYHEGNHAEKSSHSKSLEHLSHIKKRFVVSLK